MPFFIGLEEAGGSCHWQASPSVFYASACRLSIRTCQTLLLLVRVKLGARWKPLKSDTASLISFRSAVQCWLTSCSKCLGKVSSTWVTRGSFRCTAVCMECQECIANKGLAFRFESYGGEELHIFKSGVPLAACSILLNALHCFLFL